MNPQIKGMNLRDWFAGMALGGLISKVLMGSDMSDSGIIDLKIIKTISYEAYALADEMLEVKAEIEEE